MTYVNATGYQEQRFANLEGLDGLSALQVAEHLVLYAGYVRQVNILNDELAALRAQGRASGRLRLRGAMADGLPGHWRDARRGLGASLPGPRHCPRDEPLGDPASGRRARRIQAAPRDGCLGARLHARLRGEREGALHRRILPQR